MYTGVVIREGDEDMKKGILFLGDKEMYEELAEKLLNGGDYYLLPYIETEGDVIEYAQMNRIDIVVVTDLMNQYDGIEMIQRIRENSLKDVKSVLVASCKCNGIINSVMKYKIDYLLFHPLKIDILLRRLNDLYDEEYEDTNKRIKLERMAANALKNLGVPANLKGYLYLRTAIVVSIDDATNLDKITKVLYPNVASYYNTTSSRVERSIRHAIEIAYNRGNIEVFDDYFGYTIDSNKAKPTNSEFIAMVANRLKLDC